MKKQDSTASVFSALSDPTRRQVMMALSNGPASASSLTSKIPISRQAIAKHLDALQQAGLVSAERVGRETKFRLTPGPMGEALDWMAEVGAEWDNRLARLRRLMDQ